MFQLDQMIHSRMTVSEVVQRWPGTGGVLDRLGVRSVCQDDDELHTVARRQGLSTNELMLALNLEVFGSSVPARVVAGSRCA